MDYARIAENLRLLEVAGCSPAELKEALIAMRGKSATVVADVMPSTIDHKDKPAENMILEAIGAKPSPTLFADVMEVIEKPVEKPVKKVTTYADRAALAADKEEPVTGGSGTQTASHKYSDLLKVQYEKAIKDYYGDLQFKTADDIWWMTRLLEEDGSWFSIVDVHVETMKIKLNFGNAPYLMDRLGLTKTGEKVDFISNHKGKAFRFAMMKVIADKLNDSDIQKDVLLSIVHPTNEKTKWGVHASKASTSKALKLNPYTGNLSFE